MYDVSIAVCPSYDAAVCRRGLEEVLAPIGGLDFVRPGMKIAIKANLVAAMKPEKAATTHPVLLRQLTELLRERGASVVIGDSPGGLYNAAFVGNVYRAAGLALAEEGGAVLNRDFSQATARFPEAAVAWEFQYTRYLDDADVIINFCKLKTHGMMGMSAATKNLFGTIPGSLKPEYHFKYSDPADFARLLVDICQYWKPQISIVDAVVGMEGNGPTAGNPKEIGLLLAGANAHKVDLACAALLGLRKEDVPTLEAAFERGLIPASAEDLAICGSLCPVVGFQNAGAHTSHLFTGRSSGPWGKIKSSVMGWALNSRPNVEKSQCISCRKCETICPAKAIVMKKGLPVIDRGKCIRCFCCQEFCPKGAMKVHRMWIARLLNH